VKIQYVGKIQYAAIWEGGGEEGRQAVTERSETKKKKNKKNKIKIKIKAKQIQKKRKNRQRN